MAQQAGRVPSAPTLGSRSRAEIHADPATAAAIRRSSWMPLLLGVWAVLAGILTIIWPGSTVLALAIIFGVFLVIPGPMQIVHAVQLRGHAREWWLLLVRGVADLALGVLTLVWPGITVLVLALLFGIDVLLLGVFEPAGAIRARAVRRDWTWYLARGLVAIGLGIVTVAWPDITVFALALLLGFA